MLFNSLSFPWFFFDLKGGLLERGSGSLFDLPSECASDAHIQMFSRLKGGWSNCPIGYAVYSRKIAAADTATATPGILVIPGLKVRGRSTIQGKNIGLTIYTEQQKIEKHVEMVLITESQLNERFDRLTRQNTHEIRGLNNGLYHAAEELRRLIKESGKTSSKEFSLARSIVALSQILSVRLDLVNYLSDEEMIETIVEEIPVYAKFDKIRKCFIAQADKKKIGIRMLGSDYSTTLGPSNSVEIMAYLVLDNAIKYSPPGKTITIDVSNKGSSVAVSISSVGPHIADEEFDKIFEMDFRSKEAVRSGRPGSGIGLNVLKRLVVDAFGGNVSVERGPLSDYIRSVRFDEIMFTIKFPIIN